MQNVQLKLFAGDVVCWSSGLRATVNISVCVCVGKYPAPPAQSVQW